MSWQLSTPGSLWPKTAEAKQLLPLPGGDEEASCTWEPNTHHIQDEAREGTEEQQRGTGTSNSLQSRGCHKGGLRIQTTWKRPQLGKKPPWKKHREVLTIGRAMTVFRAGSWGAREKPIERSLILEVT